MKALDFTKKTSKLADKLVKLGFRYDERRGANYELITTPRKYVRITDAYTDTGVSMSVEEFMELEEITNSLGSTFPRPEIRFERITN